MKLLLLIITILIAVGAFFTQKTESQKIVSSVKSFFLKSPAFPMNSEKVFEFKNTAHFVNNTISTNDGEFMKVNCPLDAEIKTPFAKIRLDQEKTSELHCLEDYMGGIFLVTPFLQDKKRDILLSQQDADAGDIWDIRSWVTRNESGELVVETLFLYSTEDLENGKIESCTEDFGAYKWNSKSSQFEEIANVDKRDTSLLHKPIHVAKDCLDEQGNWAGPKKSN